MPRRSHLSDCTVAEQRLIGTEDTYNTIMSDAMFSMPDWCPGLEFISNGLFSQKAAVSLLLARLFPWKLSNLPALPVICFSFAVLRMVLPGTGKMTPQTPAWAVVPRPMKA
jgi:hypothetical protein